MSCATATPAESASAAIPAPSTLPILHLLFVMSSLLEKGAAASSRRRPCPGPLGNLEPVVEVEAELPPVLPGHAVDRRLEDITGEERRVVRVLVVLERGVPEADKGPLREGVVVADVPLRGARVRLRGRLAREPVRDVERVGPER